MTIPVDSEGRFEAVADGTGVVLGEGEVVNGAVTYRYGDADAEGRRGHTVVLPEPEFEQAWAVLPQARDTTLRAAAG